MRLDRVFEAGTIVTWCPNPMLALHAHSIRHKYRPIIDRTFPLSEIVEAHRYLDAYVCLGKVVVLPRVMGAKG